MKQATSFTRSIEAGLAYLTRTQEPSGEIPGIVSPDPEMTGGKRDSTIFTTALAAMELFDVPEAKAVIERAGRFLAVEQAAEGRWKHWVRSHVSFTFLPADSDDTACAAAVIERLGYSVEKAKQALLKMRDRQGRFRTWYNTERSPLGYYYRLRYTPLWRVTPAEPDDVDAVVNANVINFLGRVPETERAIAWLESMADLTTVPEKWYLDAPVRAWGFARIARLLRPRSPLIQALEVYVAGEMRRADELVPLHAALIGEAAARLGLDAGGVAGCAARVAATQSEDGSWPRCAFYCGGPACAHFWGGEALSTAFCVALLARQSG